MLTFPPFRISRSCTLALSVHVFLDCTWRSIIETIKRVHGLSVHHMVDSRLIKITCEMLNLGFSDVCLQQVHRFSANLSVVYHLKVYELKVYEPKVYEPEGIRTKVYELKIQFYSKLTFVALLRLRTQSCPRPTRVSFSCTSSRSNTSHSPICPVRLALPAHLPQLRAV